MKSRRTFRTHTRSGFSLVEVTLALGIVAFAMTILLALLGTALDTGGEVTDRREAYQSIDALRQYLADEVDFDGAYTWALEEIDQALVGEEIDQALVGEETGKALVYVSYRVDAAGEPDTDGRAVRSKWLDPADSPTYQDYEAAREGSWIKARLRLDENLNPIGLVSDPSASPPVKGIGDYTADTYPHAYLVFQAEVYEVGAPDLSVEPWDISPAPPKPFFTAPVVVRR